MIKIRTKKWSIGLVVAWCVFSGFVSSTTSFLVSAPKKSDQYQIAKGGVAWIRNSDFEVCIRPANEIETGGSTVLLFAIPFRHKIKDDKFHFRDSRYYYNAVIEHTRPEKFVVELYLNPRNKSLRFNPLASRLLIYGKEINADRYYIVGGHLLQPPEYADSTHFFDYERNKDYVHIEQAFAEPLMENISHEIKTVCGFILEFDTPAPIPGVNVFTLILKGLETDRGNQPPVTLEYRETQKREVFNF